VGFPNKTSDDPTDKKPSDWVDDAKIDDPNAKQPADWVDEPKHRDPTATKPEEWDDDEDGVWEAPLVDNPKYKGAWFAKRIDNPKYNGVWKPKQLPNPEYVEDVYAYDDIGAVGFELWTVNKGSIFDNILVTDSFEYAKAVAEKVWKPFVQKEKNLKKEMDKKTDKGSAEGKDGDDDDDDDEDETKTRDKKEDL